MARRPPPDLEPRRVLARLINQALIEGQNAKRPGKKEVWTNKSFGDAVKPSVTEAAVRAWRDTDNPTRPPNIQPLLDVFYGTLECFKDDRARMHEAWGRSSRYFEEEAPAPPRPMAAKHFSDEVHIVDLQVSQPTPGNTGNLAVAFTLHIYPDVTPKYANVEVEIGITRAVLAFQSQHWVPSADSVFRTKRHANVSPNAEPCILPLVGPTDDIGRMKGAPLGDQISVMLEPSGVESEDGPFRFKVCVPPDGFDVRIPGALTPSPEQKAVMDAILAEPFERDTKKRLVVASHTKFPRAPKLPD